MKLVIPLVAIVLAGLAGCQTEDPTMVVVDDDYPVLEGGGAAMETTVLKAWWVTSLLPDAVVPGAEGVAERTVPGTDFAYAVLAPGWDPSSSAPPPRFVVAKSTAKLTANLGDTLHVRVSTATFLGDCAAGQPLSQDDVDFITQRIFPGEFPGLAYDAASCTARAVDEEAGASIDGGAAVPADGDAPDAAGD
jgi:hypothetical protein